MTCPNCSSEIPAGQSFCGSCGAAAPTTAAAPTSADLAPPPPPPPPSGSVPPPPAGTVWSPQVATPVRVGVGGLGWGLLAAGVVLVIGSFMPWATASFMMFSETINGTEGDGTITAVLGIGIVVVAVLLAKGVGSRKLWILALILAGLAAAISIYHTTNVAGMASDANVAGVEVTVDTGLWLCAIASVVAVVLTIVIAVRPTKPAVVPPA